MDYVEVVKKDPEQIFVFGKPLVYKCAEIAGGTDVHYVVPVNHYEVKILSYDTFWRLYQKV